MTALATRAKGIYTLDEDTYHADPALSSTGARKLLAPSCPALYRYEQDNPPPPKKTFDLGHAAHKAVLGIGPRIVEIPADTLASNGAVSTKAAKEFVEQARAAGSVPLHPDDCEVVAAMGAALLAHPYASLLFEAGSGVAEPSLFWDDPAGIQRRARFDWLRNRSKGRLIIPDYKTAACAEAGKFTRSAMDYGYHQQGAWYRDAAIALELDDNPVFVFVVQEKTAPYLVNVIQLDVNAMRIGQILNRQAITLFAECTRSGVWPGYSDEVELASLPVWYERLFEDQL